MKQTIFKLLVATAAAVSLLPVSGQVIQKADNSDDLPQGSSWVGGVAPNVGNIAIWSALVTNSASASLGAAGVLLCDAISFQNPKADFTIQSGGPGSGLYLYTNNGVAIDLSTATRNLTINADLYPQYNQTWTIASGRTLTLGGTIAFPAATTEMKKTGAGTVLLTGAGGAGSYGVVTIVDGPAAVSGGADRLPTGTALQIGNASFNLNGNSQTLGQFRFANTFTSNTVSAVASNGTIRVDNAVRTTDNDFAAGPNSVFDMSGLASFTFEGVNRNFRVLPWGQLQNNVTNTLWLSRTANTIKANNFQVGGASGSSANNNHMGIARLGAANTIHANNFQFGGFNGRGSASFQTALVNPTLTVRDTSGTGRLPTLRVGETSSGSRSGDGVLDLSAGTVDILATNIQLGRMIAGANVNDISTLTFAAGTVDAHTLTMAFKSGSGNPTLTSTLNQLGGTMTVSNVIMGVNAETAAAFPVLRPSYNLGDGVLRAALIAAGTGSNNASSTRLLNWTNGVIRPYDASTDLVIRDVVINALTNGNRSFTVDAGRTITASNRINQGNAAARAIAKDGDGILDLTGTADNAYLGLKVNAGTVWLNKASSASVHALGNDSSIEAGLIKITGSGGDQIANDRSLALNGGSFDLNGNSETLGGLAGSAGSVVNSGALTALTLAIPAGSNLVSSASLNNDIDLVKGGTGRQTLAGGDNRTSGANTVNAGMLEIGNGGATGNLLGDVTVNAGGTLGFNRSGTLTVNSTITGAGNVAQNGPGILILAGADSHTGSTLVNSGTLKLPVGATMVAGSAITVQTNATFDVSPAAGSFFLSGQTLNGQGTVTGSLFAGNACTVSGTLTIQGTLTHGDSSTNAPGGTLAAGTVTITGGLTLNPGTVLSFDLSNLTTTGGGVNDLLAVGGVVDVSSGPVTLNVLPVAGTLANGTYVLATFSSFNGPVSNIQIPPSLRYAYSLSVSANQLRLGVVGSPGSMVWRGDGAVNLWDDALTPNWYNTTAAALQPFFAGDAAIFDNTGSNNVPIYLATAIFPGSVSVNASQDYVLSGPGKLSGAAGFTKSGAGTFTLETPANDFSGAVNLNGGAVSVTNLALGGQPSPLGTTPVFSFNGGSLRYAGPSLQAAAFDRSLVLGPGGGTLDVQGSAAFLFVTNLISGSGPLTKAGTNQLILGQTAANAGIAGNNTYDGITYVHEGQLQVRHPNALGATAGKTVVIEPGNLAVGGGLVAEIAEPFDLTGNGNGTGALQANDGGTEARLTGAVTLVGNSSLGGASAMLVMSPVTGSGALEKLGGGTVTLVNNANSYTGGTVISGGSLRLGTNGTTGWIAPQPVGVALTNNANLIFNRADTNTLAAAVTGTGSLTQNGSGGTLLPVANDFTGPVIINGGELHVTHPQALGAATNGTTVNGGTGNGRLALSGGLSLAEPLLLGQKTFINGGVGSQVPHVVNLGGNNTITEMVRLLGGGNCWPLQSDSGLLTVNSLTNEAGGFIRPLILQGAGNGVIANAIYDTNEWLQIQKHGSGSWTLQGADLAVPRGLRVFEGRLVLHPAAVLNTGPSFVQTGASTVEGGTLIVNNTFGFPLTVNSGTLGGTGVISGAVTASAGFINPGDSSIGTLSLAGGLTLSSGSTILLELNRTHPLTNDQLNAFFNPGGTLQVANVGPPLAVGDKFQLFTSALFGEFGATNLPAGYTWQNNLGLDGSIEVLSVLPPSIPTTPTNITCSVTANQLTLSWPSNYVGWTLQAQTNLLTVGISNHWVSIPSSTTTNRFTVPVNPANPTVFYRLTYTP